MTERPNDEFARIDLLLEESRSSRFTDPARMVYFAELAQAAAHRLSPDHHSPLVVADTQARVWAELGNAYRLADALDSAEAAFVQSVDALERGSGAPLLAALVADRFAALLCHRRRFDEAFALLDRLSTFYLAAEERHLAGRALVIRGAYEENAGNPQACALYTAKGLELIDSREEPGLLLSAVHNLLSSAADLGHFSLAAEFLPVIRPLYGSDRLNLLRLRWLEGRVAAGLGKTVEAEEAFRAVKAGFAEARLIFPAGLVMLDLALLLDREGRTAEIVPLAEEMLTFFQALQIGREAVVSLLLLRRSCEERAQAAITVPERILTVRRIVLEMERRQR